MSESKLTVRERPILFRGEMVRAILAGDKTQTRRMVKGPVCVEKEAYADDPSMVWFGAYGPRKGCPYGVVGDRLWVRENILQSNKGYTLPSGEYYNYWCAEKVEYLADVPTPQKRYLQPGVYGSAYMMSRPSIHMPRWASRILLEIVAVRIERLQEITRGDAMAEGCPFSNMAKGPDPREWFRELWGRVNGEGSWEANWFVWVVEFKVIKGGLA